MFCKLNNSDTFVQSLTHLILKDDRQLFSTRIQSDFADSKAQFYL